MKKNNTNNYLIIILLGLINLPALFGQEFLLPDGYFIPARMPMHLVYPRPNTETPSHVRHKWAHPEMSYEIPVGMQGGAWPFKYEVIDGPAGLEIGEMYGEENYGIISWMPPSSGSFDVTIRITDQEMNVVEAEWDITVDSTKFIFIEDGWSGNKVGTIDEPLEDIEDWYKNDLQDSTYKNKIIVFRGGSYLLKGAPEQNNNLRLNSNTKTPTLIGFPGETPIIDCSEAKIFTFEGSNSTISTDIFIADIRWENARQDVPNAHFFWAISDVSRSTWWRNYFYHFRPGQEGTDNNSALFVNSSPYIKENILYKHNIHDDFENRFTNGSYVDIYQASYVLMEENIAKNSSTASGFLAKATHDYVTIRANEAYENVDGLQISVNYQTHPSITEEPSHHEICWNRARVPENELDNPILLCVGEVFTNQHHHTFAYRNTFVNGRTNFRFEGADPFYVDGNVIVENYEFKDSLMSIEIENVHGDQNEGITDQTGMLIGTYRDQYLGKAGHEIWKPESTNIDDLKLENERNILGQNYPNPFANNTTIPFQLNQSAWVQFEFYDLSGRLIYSGNREWKLSGWHEYDVSLNNLKTKMRGQKTCIYLLKVNGESLLRKMIVF